MIELDDSWIDKAGFNFEQRWLQRLRSLPTEEQSAQAGAAIALREFAHWCEIQDRWIAGARYGREAKTAANQIDPKELY